jgi:hypothetical protein
MQNTEQNTARDLRLELERERTKHETAKPK